jgi:hypothetical protein
MLNCIQAFTPRPLGQKITTGQRNDFLHKAKH